MNKIKSFSNSGLEYIDDLGNVNTIDFCECNKDWLQYRKRSENLSEEMFSEIEKTDKCIGQRDICENPSFIEFFTRPKFTRFEFDSSDDMKLSFKTLKDTIIAGGWSTIDLS